MNQPLKLQLGYGAARDDYKLTLRGRRLQQMILSSRDATDIPKMQIRKAVTLNNGSCSRPELCEDAKLVKWRLMKHEEQLHHQVEDFNEHENEKASPLRLRHNG